MAEPAVEKTDKKGKPPTADSRRALVVREVSCKTTLNPSAISDYCLNCYTGCGHGCVYCYARFMQRFRPHPEPWGAFVDVKVNAVEVLQRQVKRLRPGEVFTSSVCDGWQPIENKYELTRGCVRLLLDHGFRVNVLTKSALVLRDLDVLLRGRARVAVTVTTLDEGLRRLWEPGASGVEQRFAVLQEARLAGLETGVMFGPLLPYLSDDQDSIEGLLERAAELEVDVIWVDGLNPRPKVWESVKGLLAREFPHLRDRYGRILFSGPARAAYLRDLRERVACAAAKIGLSDRVTCCL